MYKVLLLRDASLDLMFVVRTVMQLTRLCRAEATNKMWEAVHHGQSVLSSPTANGGIVRGAVQQHRADDALEPA
jgi:ATP-dependent Clp protease adapter protein ClpS